MGATRSFLPRRIALWCLAAALVLPGVLGCGNDSSPTSSGDSARFPGRAGILQGELNPGEIDFEILSLANGDPDNPEPGPYALRGRNLTFDAEAGGITVDLSVENLGEETYPEPITLTFISLSPEGVTVENSENGESGAGAGFAFSLPDEDGQWTPNEESLPRETIFGVDPGVSISFVARIDAGSGLGGMGSIGGVVFNDENGNGTMDEGEAGVSGVTLELTSDGMDAQTTTSSEDGCYRFDGLEAGFYRVEKMVSEGVVPTTPVEFFVTLTENEDGEINTFLNANFGCQAESDGTDLPLEDGDCVKIDGHFDMDSGVLVATKIHVHNHRHDDYDDDDDDDDCDDKMSGGDDDCDDDDDDNDKTGGGYGNCGKLELRGPVTDQNGDKTGGSQVIEIMGTRVKLVGWWKGGDHGHDDDFEVGDRARVDVFVGWPMNDTYFGHKLKKWNGKKDRVRGFVHEIGDDQFQVLGTTIQVTPDTEWED